MGLLTTADKERIKRVIPKPSNKIVAVAVARLYIAHPDPSSWTYSGLSGAIVLVNDLVGNTFFLKLVDISTNRGVLWDQELYVDFQYFQDRSFFHSFELETCFAGFLFADEAEAAAFFKKVQHKEKHASKATLNNKNAVAMKKTAAPAGPTAGTGLRGDAAGMRQRIHINTGVVYYDDEPPVEWRALYAELANAGITEEMIADNREFIKSYIRQQGGPLVGLEPPIPRKAQQSRHYPAATPESEYASPPAPASPAESQFQQTRRTRAPPPPPPAATAPPVVTQSYTPEPESEDDEQDRQSTPEPVTPKASIPHRVPPPMPFIGSNVPNHPVAVPAPPPAAPPAPAAPPSLPSRAANGPPLPPLPPQHPSMAPPLQDRPLPAPPQLPPRMPLAAGQDYTPRFGTPASPQGYGAPAPSPYANAPSPYANAPSPYGASPYGSTPPPPPPQRNGLASPYSPAPAAATPPPPPPPRAGGGVPPPPPPPRAGGSSAMVPPPPPSRGPAASPYTATPPPPPRAPVQPAQSPYAPPAPPPAPPPAQPAAAPYTPPPPPKTPSYTAAPPPAPPMLSSPGAAPPAPPPLPPAMAGGMPAPPAPPAPNLGMAPPAPPPPSLGAPPPPPPPNLGGAPPPPPPAPSLGGAAPAPMPAVSSDHDALLASIRGAGGVGGLRKVDKSQLDRPSVLLMEAKGQAPPPSAGGGGGAPGQPASLADALADALNKRKNKVAGSDDEESDDGW